MGSLSRGRVETRSARGTRGFAARLAAELGPGAVLALAGEMGAGKTTFVQGLAAGWEVEDLRQVVSPTYTLVNEYPGPRGVLYHLDFYRLDSAASARALGLDELVGGRQGLVVIEWADRFPELVPGGALWVRLHRGLGTQRRIEVGSPSGEVARGDRES